MNRLARDSCARRPNSSLRPAISSELAAGLHPRELDGAWACRGARFPGRIGARSPLSSPSTLRASSPEVESTVFFVCSEALANVAKYARASRVVMIVQAANGELRVEIADDGSAEPASRTGPASAD